MNRYRNLVLVFALCFATFAFAQDSLNVRRVGQIALSGNTYDVAVVGNYAYVANDNGLRIIDISNPASPTVTGFCNSGWGNSLAISGNYAYVTSESGGLRIIDISNPNAPVVVSFVNSLDYTFGVAVSDSLAFVADFWDGLVIFNITNPASPTAVGSGFPWPGMHAVAVSGNYAYVTSDPDGLESMQVIDITNPANPVEVGACNTYAPDMIIAGNYAYLAAGFWGLKVIDISNPAAPFTWASYNTTGYAEGISVSGHHAFVADGSGLRVINVNNPAIPIEVGFYLTPGSALGVDVVGTLAYVADFNNLGIYDCSDAIFAPSIDIFPTELDFGNVMVNQASDLILKIRNLGGLPLDVTAISVSVPYTHLFTLPLTVAAGDSVSDTVRFHPMDEQHYGYLLEIASNSPTGITYVPVSGDGDHPELNVSPVHLDFGIVPVGNDSVRMLTILNSGTVPLTVTGITTPIGFTQSFNLPCIIAVDSSITDSVIFHPDTTRSYGGNLIIASNIPLSPTPVPVSGFGFPPLSVGQTAFGIPRDYILHQNSPNPFNPSTSIAFELPKAGLTTLTVYNLLGQSVAELMNANLQAGQHRVEFDGSSLASGLYICKLQSGSFNATRKLMLLE